MRLARAVPLAVVAALVPAATAAADVTINAVDGTPADNFNNRWSPPDVTIRSGEAVTWTFPDSNGFHNVASTSDNWTLDSEISARHEPVTHVFSTPGVYRFVCEAHVSTMYGTVTVTDTSGEPPPPPPPPPPGEQPWANDQPGPSKFERVDERRPRLTRVRLRHVRNGARVRFRISERARVRVRFKLAGITVESKRRTYRRGRHRMTIRNRRMHGRYRVEVVARDLAGNRSRTVKRRIRLGYRR